MEKKENLPSQLEHLRVDHFWRSFLISFGILLITLLLVKFSTSANQLSQTLFTAINQNLPSRIGNTALIYMEIGSVAGAILIVLVLLLLRKYAIALALTAANVISVLLANGIKLFTQFNRPFIALKDTAIVRTPIEDAVSAVRLNDSGFPSGHTAAVVIIATLIWPYLTTSLRVLSCILIALVGLGRVYAGVHFPIDIIGGIGLGLTIGLGVRQITL